MRPRAGTTLMLSTVANTAFSSATGRRATIRVCAPAAWTLNANVASMLKKVDLRIRVAFPLLAVVRAFR